jgi:hypothetical protein
VNLKKCWNEIPLIVKVLMWSLAIGAMIRTIDLIEPLELEEEKVFILKRRLEDEYC